MHYVAAMLFIGLLATGAATLYATAGQLPARVASHFNLEGFANGYMARDDYLILMSLLLVVLPLVVLALNFGLPRLAPRLTQIPARDYWLAPERRNETYASIATSGFLIASMVAAFTTALHLLVVDANRQTPPRLDNAVLWTLVAVVVVAALSWKFFRWRRFQPPR